MNEFDPNRLQSIDDMDDFQLLEITSNLADVYFPDLTISERFDKAIYLVPRVRLFCSCRQVVFQERQGLVETDSSSCNDESAL